MEDGSESQGSGEFATPQAAVHGASSDALRSASYSETLRTPWWWYIVAVFVASLLAAEFHIGGLSLTDWIPWCTLLPGAALIVWWIGRGKLTIADGEISIRGSHLPLKYCSGVVALDARTLRRVVGREGDPAAYIEIRPWIGPGVQFWIDDQDDPAPYWIVSTRHPDEVVAAARRAIGTPRGDDDAPH